MKGILKTPTRPLRTEDLLQPTSPEDNEAEAYPEADLTTKDLITTFRAFALFNFKGQSRYRDGKLFLDRFRGNIRTHANTKTLYVSNLISEFFQIVKPIPVYVDNKGAGFIAENNINNKMTKHIDIRYHFVRYYIKDGTIELFYVPTAANIADALTKALVAEIHKRLLAKLLGIA